MLIELLLRVTKERDELHEKNRQLHQDLWHAVQRQHESTSIKTDVT
jgi:hypothetical protein